MNLTCFVSRSAFSVAVMLDLFLRNSRYLFLTGCIFVALLKRGFGIQPWIPVG